MGNVTRVTVPVVSAAHRSEAEALAEVLRSRGRANSKHDINRAANLLELLSAAPAPEGGAFDGESDGDTPLQAAAREAGWALSSMIDSAPWERRGQLQRIVERLGSAIDRLVWPWPGDDDRHDQIRAAWRAYADDHVDDDGKIDVTEVDTCVAIACMKTIQLLSPVLATREDAQPVAYDARKLKKGDQVWIRATVTDPCTSCCGVSVKSATGSEVHRYIAPADVRAHPAPDALRGAREALEKIRLQSEDCLGVRMETITAIADQALAVLQAEQKGGA